MTSWKGIALVLSLALAPAARAANPQIVPCPPPNQSLLTIPEITRSPDGKLRGTLEMVDGLRTIADTTTSRCASQNLRYLRGYQGFDAAAATPWPAGGDPLPGPTFRARVGDLVEIAFFNEVNLENFAAELDKGAVGTTAACDQYTTSAAGGTSTTGPSTATDKMPNCLHGSSTTNVHFHGTHTTPSTTGDNVLLFVRPAIQLGGELQPSRAQTNANFAQVFSRCEQQGPPKQWADLPTTWQGLQQDLIEQYDRTAVYKGQVGALPVENQLWPANKAAIDEGQWPQYQLGAYPYCFPLPAYGGNNISMGQAPGTHWYHAHKHGSTALNVANGMTGAFVIEGQYDDQLRDYYGPAFKDQVMVVQQLASTPVTTVSTVAVRPALSVNGRLVPVVTMRPGEVQQWRLVNASFRDAFEVYYSEAQATKSCAAATPPATSPVQWRQIAQDGVQFDVKNYQTLGRVNATLNVAPGNRADLLVQAPTKVGSYTLCVRRNGAIFVYGGSSSSNAPDAPSALLTVKVAGSPASMDFIPDDRFPTLPPFLADIPESDIDVRRELTFSGSTDINGKPFQEHVVSQTMQLNTAEEWTVSNQTSSVGHPFHIHVNPFQITELFEPNRPEATTPGNPCYVDPNNPTTFKPCPSKQPQAPYAWWDTFAIPTSQVIKLTCTEIGQCPENLRPYISCSNNVCYETIPGYFKLRSRFVDYTGDFVLHCHILTHEDRGMMQVVRVVTDATASGHH